MTDVKYAIIDDKYNYFNEQHAAKVSSVVDHYLTQFGYNPVEDIFQMPNANLTESQAIDAALNSSASVAFNNSWAEPAASHAEGAMYLFYPDTYKTMETAFLNNKTLVFAAGNSGQSTPLSTTVEASTPFTINASAMDKDASGNNELTWYSSANPGMTNYVTYGTAQYYTADPTSIGTSFAAPRITALVAMLQTKYNNQLSQSDIHTILDLNSNGETLNANGHPEIGGYVYHVIDENAITNIMNYNYVPGQVNNKMQVEALYNLELDRVGDKGGLDFWTSIADQKGIAYVAQQMKGSSEYATASSHVIDQVPLFEKMQAMYHLFLNRESDDSGIAWWMDHVIQTQTPNMTQITTTGQHFDFSTIENQFVAAAGQHLPTWF